MFNAKNMEAAGGVAPPDKRFAILRFLHGCAALKSIESIKLSCRFNLSKWFVFVFIINEFHYTCGRINHKNINPIMF